MESLIYKSKIAFFDYDKTLTNDDTILIYAHFLLKRTGELYKYPIVILLVILFNFNIIDEKFFKENLCKILVKNKNIEFIKAIVNQFYEFYGHSIFNNQINKKLLEHFRDGYKIYINSSNFIFFLEPLIDKLPLEEIIATAVETKNSYYTGKISGKVCNAKEKVSRAYILLNHFESFYIIGYGDSKGDFDLLNTCNEAFLIKRKNKNNIEKILRVVDALLGKFDLKESEIVIEPYN